MSNFPMVTATVIFIAAVTCLLLSTPKDASCKWGYKYEFGK